MLICDPSEIVFALDQSSLASKRSVNTFVTLRNQSDTETLAYFVKTTQPAKYAVRPSQGVIPPRGSLPVTVLMAVKKPLGPLGVQKADKFLFQYGPVSPSTTAEQAKDALKEVTARAGPDGIPENDPTALTGALKLKVRYKDAPRAPSTISEGANEGASLTGQLTPQASSAADLLPPPSAGGGDASASAAKARAPPAPSPYSRTAEVSSARQEVHSLTEELDSLQASVDQLRLHAAPAGKALSTSDAFALTRRGASGLSVLHLILVALLAAFLGVLSQYVDRDSVTVRIIEATEQIGRQVVARVNEAISPA